MASSADPSSTPERRGGTQPAERILGTRAQRGASLARLSASTGAGLVGAKVRGLRNDEAEARFHTETAQKMLELLGSMKGAAMKLGQIASFVDLDLPPEVQATYHGVLGTLRDAAPAMDARAIAEAVTAEYGAPPEEVFAEWSPQPLASASIGQVHAATLPDGTRVVAKVQYPGVAEAVESDLANAEMFAPMARLVSPNLQIKPLLDEMRARVADELDYQREATYQQAFADRYDGHPFIRVPRVFAEFSRPRVLVSERIDGVDFDTMVATSTPEQHQRYAEIIYRFVFGSLNRFRLFNADPHPGNYLFPGNGTVAFVDFGSTKLFPSAVRDAIIRQMRALVADDADELLAIMDDQGFLPPGHRVDRERLVTWFRIFNQPILEDAEYTYTPDFAREVIRTTTDPRLGYVDMLRKLNLPPDYLLLNRIQWGVNSILGRLRARANWQRIAMEFWNSGPPATPLGEEERPFIDASPYLA